MPRVAPAPDRTLYLTALFLAAAGLGPASFASAQDADPDKLRAVQGELDEAKRRRAALADEQTRLAAEVARLKDELVQRAISLRARESAATALERRLAELGASEAEKLAALADRRAALSRLLGALTRLSRRPPVLLMVERQNALELAHTGTVLRNLVPHLRDRASALSRDLAALGALRTRLASDRASLEATLAALAIERGEIDRLLAQKAQDSKRLAQLEQTERRRVDTLSARAKSIEELIAAVEREREEQARQVAQAAARAAAERIAAQAAAQPPQAQAVTVATPEVPDTPAQAAPAPVMARFSTLKGKLAWPAAGEIVARFGDAQGNGLTSRGFRIATRAGAAVTSPAAGDVAFAGPFRGYGQLLILAQGDGYHLLLAGMERIDVAVGQKVLAGEPVGQMAGANDGARPMLYVELRHDGEPVDLTPWLVPGATKVSG
jgi:septal ring factor EnvC (AmiA/AmiB activator)